MKRETTVRGEPAQFYRDGSGPVVVFVHGWGIASSPAYLDAVRELPRYGFTVIAPVLPGFGSGRLPRDRFSLGGYAEWLAEFIDAIGVEQPVALVGYSFGGGVAIRAAHDRPEVVERLVLVNSIGGSTWTNRRGSTMGIGRRPLWDWGLHLGADFTARREATRGPTLVKPKSPGPRRGARVQGFGRRVSARPPAAGLICHFVPDRKFPLCAAPCACRNGREKAL